MDEHSMAERVKEAQAEMSTWCPTLREQMTQALVNLKHAVAESEKRLEVPDDYWPPY